MSKTKNRRNMPQKTNKSSAYQEFASTVAKAQGQDQGGKKLESRRAFDAFCNAVARLGVNTNNLLESTEYLMTRLTRNYQLMNTLYRENWIVGKIIDTKPGDMVKNWYKVNSEVSPEMLERLTKIERKTRVKAKILEGLKWGDLYGGAAGIMLIHGQGDILQEPLDIDSIMPGDFRGLLILDRWSGITPNLEVVTDISDPEFGYPKTYTVTPETGEPFKVDHTRVLRFTGRSLPFWEKVAEMHWGASELERVYQELVKRDNTSYNIASLIFLANLRVLKMNDLGGLLGSGNIESQKDLYNTIQAQNWLMSNMGMQILDKEDDFSTHQYSFSGINDIYESFMLDVCGASEIPMTRLFGRTITGLGQGNEGDEQIYYDMIGQRQEEKLTPIMDKLLPVIIMSTWGFVPDDLDFEWNPVGEATDEEKAELTNKTVDSIDTVYNSGLIGRKTALKELRQLKETTGAFSNITDEIIEAASDDPQPAGEMPGMPDPSMMLGGQVPGQDTPAPRTLEESVNYLDQVLRGNDGGEGSGNFNHEGRPGEVGGSGSIDPEVLTSSNGKQYKVVYEPPLDTVRSYTAEGNYRLYIQGSGERTFKKQSTMSPTAEGLKNVIKHLTEQEGHKIISSEIVKTPEKEKHKENHELTFEEYFNTRYTPKPLPGDNEKTLKAKRFYAREQHEKFVKNGKAAGKEIPDNVLEDYPSLK